VFENRVLGKIFGTRGDEVTGRWRKLHNEELHDWNSSPSIIGMMKSRRMRWTRHVARMGEKRKAYRLLVGKPEGKRSLGRPRLRWLDGWILQREYGEDGLDWVWWYCTVMVGHRQRLPNHLQGTRAHTPDQWILPLLEGAAGGFFWNVPEPSNVSP
jgi:hypothetical protein